MGKDHKKMKKKGVIRADSNLWSEKSKNSYSFGTTEYKDIKYNCWHCNKPSVFSAEDQKYTYETKKAYIWQARILCHDCWIESLKIKRDISKKEKQWNQDRKILSSNRIFLTEWLDLLERRDKYIRVGSNVAIKNMLRKQLSKLET